MGQRLLGHPLCHTSKSPLTVVARNYDKDSGDTAVVFQCSYMDSDTAVRNEAVQVTVATYSGVLVNQAALRFEDVEYTTTDEDGNTVTQVAENVRGVYVLSRRPAGVCPGVHRPLCQWLRHLQRQSSPSQEQAALVTSSTIQLYDQVAVEGRIRMMEKLISSASRYLMRTTPRRRLPLPRKRRGAGPRTSPCRPPRKPSPLR